jgi:tetratricopeptide (TPR) repeat protein
MSAVALAGRRVDGPDAKEARFSPDDVPVVRERLAAELGKAKPAILVSSAACGADLLALDEAAKLGIARRIVLPFARDKFRASSVVDRPGTWGALFDRLVGQAERDGALVVLDAGEGDEAYAAANGAILDEAQRAGAGAAEAWIVWNGRPRGEGDLTLAFADEAWKRQLPVREIATLSAADGPTGPVENTKTCFVVMPFGTKTVDGRDVPFDAIFSTILAPAIAAVTLPEGGALRPYRTDKDLGATMIDQDMFERLEYSRFVLGDLTGLNPNVMFELGMRYRSRANGTALFRQPGTKLPFDIASVKVFEYDTTQPATARRTIGRVLQESLAQNRIDSPIRRALEERVAGAESAGVEQLLRDAEEALRNWDPATARAKYAEAARLAPGDPVVLVRLATLEKQAGRWPEVLAAATRATEVAPGYGEAWRERGVAEGQLWRKAVDRAGLPDGVASLREAIRLNPRDFDAHASLGGILRRQGKLSEALEAYRASLAVSGGHPYPLLNVLKLEAELYGRMDLESRAGDLERAARMREPQTAANPPYDAPWCFFDLAEIRLYQSRPADAVKALEAGRSWYGEAQRLRDFRDLLAKLKTAGVVLDGLDQVIAYADRMLASG